MVQDVSYGQASSESISIEKHRPDIFLTSRVPPSSTIAINGCVSMIIYAYTVAVHLCLQYYYAVACYNEITFQSISLSVIVPQNFVVYFNI